MEDKLLVSSLQWGIILRMFSVVASSIMLLEKMGNKGISHQDLSLSPSEQSHGCYVAVRRVNQTRLSASGTQRVLSSIHDSKLHRSRVPKGFQRVWGGPGISCVQSVWLYISKLAVS